MRVLLLLGAATRILLLLIGAWQDAYLDVKFTDIDYHVYSDAAKHVLQGGSPYDRPTYRYSPIIAWLLVPNHLLFGAWGKVLFCSADIVVAFLVLKYYKVCVPWNAIIDDHAQTFSQRLPPTQQHFAPQATPWQVLVAVSLWLFNPYIATISARGSCESPVVVVIIAMIWMLAAAKRRGAGRKGCVCLWMMVVVIIHGAAYGGTSQSSSVTSNAQHGGGWLWHLCSTDLCVTGVYTQSFMHRHWYYTLLKQHPCQRKGVLLL